MKKTIVILLILFLASLCNAQLTIYSKPNAEWWKGHLAKDIAWRWAKDIDTLVQAGQQIGTGELFFVDSNVTTEGNGTTWETAKDTLDEAINLCSVNDFIYVSQSHAESGSAANLWDADVAGITIVHLGNGSNQGTYTFADTDTTVAIGAANVTVIGGRFVAGISEVVAGIIVEAAGDNFALIGATFPEPTTSSWEFDISIQLTTGSDNVSIIGCTAFSADATGATNFLNGGAGVVNGLTVSDNFIYGEYSEAPVFSNQSDLECFISGNSLTNLTAGQFAIEFSSAPTGYLIDNKVQTDGEVTSISSGTLSVHGNTWCPNSGGNVVAAESYWEPRGIKITATSQTDDLFDVDGGAIEILSFQGRVTTAVGAVGNIISIVFDADPTWIDSDFSTAVETNADIVGTRYLFSNAVESVLTPVSDTTGNTNLMESWFCGEGMIEQLSTGSTTGAIVWYMMYRPLESGVTVTAQ